MGPRPCSASKRVIGREALLIYERHPGLFMSGYPDDDIVRHGVTHHLAALIGKPLDAASLTRKVREVLDQGSVG